MKSRMMCVFLFSILLPFFVMAVAGDAAALVITEGPFVSDVTFTSAVITWVTDEAGDSVVEYGAEPEYGLTAEGANEVREHSVSLSSLSPDTIYYYRVSSADANDNIVWSEQGTFRTLAEVARRTLSITSGPGSPGISTLVDLSINDAAGIIAADILIEYDASVLTVAELGETELVSDMLLSINKEVPGEIRISMAGAEAIPAGGGALVDIALIINADAQPGTETVLNLSDVTVYDSSGNAVPLNLENGVVEINPPGIKGDVNNDGEIRSNDAILALRIAARLMTPTYYHEWAADMNGDGSIRSNDAILILRQAAGLAAPSTLAVP